MWRLINGVFYGNPGLVRDGSVHFHCVYLLTASPKQPIAPMYGHIRQKAWYYTITLLNSS